MNRDEEMEDRKDSLTEQIIQCVIKVHQTLGPGFHESIYRNALMIELAQRHLSAVREKEIAVTYEGQEVGRYRIDLVVESSAIVELKVVEELGRAQYAQVGAYLAATGLSVGLLVNFSKDKADFRRVEL